MRRLVVLGGAIVGLSALAVPVFGHPERATVFPDPSGGSVPAYRTTGRSLVVCQANSARLLRAEFRGRRNRKTLKRRLRLANRCQFRSIQDAVNAARNNTRIQILPGVYTEPKSRAVPVDDPKCAGDYETTEGAHFLPPPVGPRSNDPPTRPNFKYQHDCPNSKSLIAIIGDSDFDRKCDAKCNLQLEGMGSKPTDTVVQGDRKKLDVIRGDRSDGLMIRNLTVEQAAFNGIDVVEINGFHFDKLVARWNQDYGILSFTADHGLYENIDAYGNGDSGVYPGSTAEGHCTRYAIEIRNVDSHDNVLGYSGTAGNSTYLHDNRFHDNNSGISTDSFASGHPGMPQDCAKWEHNEVYSNNRNDFTSANQSYCSSVPFLNRKVELVCPQFQVPVGAGIIMYGANKNLVKDNYIYDNWRSGVRLFWVPAALRGDNDPGSQMDTSNGNRFVGNHMGVKPDGTRAPNGYDFTWDEEGAGNCWEGNSGPGGGAIRSDPASLPTCPGSSIATTGSPIKQAQEVPCAAWDPVSAQQPVGCNWFQTPPKPSRARR